MRPGIFIAAILLFLARSMIAGTILVPSEQPTIQAAVNAAVSGDTISVAAGSYTGTGNWDVDPGNKTLLIRSEAGPLATVIDCGSGTGTDHTAFRIDAGRTTDLTIEGFSIQASLDYGIRIDADSSQLVVRNCRFESFPPDGAGAIYAGHALSVKMINCVVDGLSERTYLGQAYCLVDSTTFANNVEDGALKIRLCNSAIIRNTTFVNNVAYLGGAADVSHSNVTFDSCRFDGNVAHSGGGGALWIVVADVIVKHSEFVGNYGLEGGAISAHSGSNVQTMGSIFARNSADRLAAAFHVSEGAGVTIDHCTLYDNPAPGDNSNPGGQIYLSAATTNFPTATVRNSVVAFAGQGRAAVCYNQGDVDLAEWMTWECSNVYGNAEGDFTGTLATTYQMFDNVSVDPQFVDTANLDFSYQPGSPMLPESSPCGELIGASGFEPPPSWCIGIRGNINGDIEEKIDISDLTYMVNYMFQDGPAPSCLHEADNNGDLSFDIADLTYLVAYSFQGGPAPAACP